MPAALVAFSCKIMHGGLVRELGKQRMVVQSSVDGTVYIDKIYQHSVSNLLS